MSAPVPGSGGAARRLFFALWPTPLVRRTLTHLADTLPPPAQPVAAPDLHLTLLFLGQVPDDRLHDLYAAAARIRAPSLLQPLDRLEVWSGGRVCCLSGVAVAALRELHAALLAAATGLGLALEAREFLAHVTLARSPARLPAGVARPVGPPLRLAAREFVLAESGAAIAARRYRRLHGWPLL